MQHTKIALSDFDTESFQFDFEPIGHFEDVFAVFRIAAYTVSVRSRKRGERGEGNEGSRAIDVVPRRNGDVRSL